MTTTRLFGTAIAVALLGLTGAVLWDRAARASDLDAVRSLDDLRRLPGYYAVYAASLKHGVNPGFMLNVAVVESKGQCKAKSPKNAQGVLQVIPGTAKIHGIKRGLTNCRTGAEAGVLEMRRLLIKYKSDWKKSLVAYNCGAGCVKRSRLPAETRNYIKRINERGRYSASNKLHTDGKHLRKKRTGVRIDVRKKHRKRHKRHK